MKFLDLFSGIGGFREGLMREGFEPVGWCEIDKFAQEAYRAIHDMKGEYFCDDIRAIKPDELPAFDLIVGGFPCQSFSIAGKRGGIGAKTGLYQVQVKSATKAGFEIATIGDSINLERPDSTTRRGRVGKGVAQTLDTGCQQGVAVIGKDGKLKANIPDFIGTPDGIRIRRLTPLECFRLQGNPDWWYHKLRAIGYSDSQMYKRAGNAVTVNVVQAIAKRLMESI